MTARPVYVWNGTTFDQLASAAIVGIQGPQGLVGGRGPQGEQGDQGIQGIQGPPGPSVTGPQGLKGDRGLQGIQGIQGPVGPRGASVIGGTVNFNGVDADETKIKWVWHNLGRHPIIVATAKSDAGFNASLMVSIGTVTNENFELKVRNWNNSVGEATVYVSWIAM